MGKGRVLLAFLALLVLLACGDGPSGPTGQTRSYRMGFSAIPPRNDQTILLQAPELIALGRSIREPAIQALYRDFAVAMATIIRPAYLGLAAETNLIRVSAPSELYQALVPMITATAPEVRTRGFTGRIS